MSSTALRSFISRIGEEFILRVRAHLLVGAVLWRSVVLAVQRTSWPRTVREQIGKQIFFTGHEAMGLTSLLAIATGVSVVAQGVLWLSRLGQADVLGTLLIAVIFRELGPLLVNFLVIARSGTAIVTELATMRVHHEVGLLEEQGVDPMVYLVMPRTLGVAVSVFCLTLYFIAISLVTGFFFSLVLETGSRDAVTFLESVMRPIQIRDFVNLLLKTILPGVLTGVICCVEGLSIKGLATEVPQAATRAVVRSMTALLVVSAVVSVLTYL
jgi:phospholipid/cholesterol/gamma-HCH transport system permease protein